MASSFRDLIAWQKAMALIRDIYSETRSFPAEERYGITSQLRRAAASIACNLAEGHGRIAPGEFLSFVGISRGSLLETQTLLDIAEGLGLLAPGHHKALLEKSEEVLRIINGLIASLQKSKAAGAK